MILNLKQFFLEVQELIETPERITLRPIQRVFYVGEDTQHYKKYITKEEEAEFESTKHSILKAIKDIDSPQFIIDLNHGLTLNMTFNPDTKKVIGMSLTAKEKNVFDLALLQNFLTYLAKDLIIDEETPETKLEIYIAVPFILIPQIEML